MLRTGNVFKRKNKVFFGYVHNNGIFHLPMCSTTLAEFGMRSFQKKVGEINFNTSLLDELQYHGRYSD
jgi:hypothetical protein